jgi:hypothetical protein
LKTLEEGEMTRLLFCCALLLGAELPDPAHHGQNLELYQAAKVRAGADPEANVRLALWCEAYGMEAERLAHLSVALLSNPAQAAARGLLGLVAYRGEWKTPEAVEREAEGSPLLAEYNVERARTPHTADGHWKLALWCQSKGLKAEAAAHLTAVTQLAPGRSDAWRLLGCRPFKGRWLSADQFAAEEAEAQAQAKADRYWEPRLQTLKKQWRGGGEYQTKAAAELSLVRDPRAVPAIRRVFVKEEPELQLFALRVLSEFRDPEASRAIAAVSIFARSMEVRDSATEALNERDPRDFMNELIATLQRPLQYRVTPVGTSGQPGVLEVEGQRSRSRRIYQVPSLMESARYLAGGYIGYDIFGKPVVMPRGQFLYFLRSGPSEQLRNLLIAEKEAHDIPERARGRTEATLARDVRSVEKHNSRILDENVPVVEVLQAVTGQWIGNDRDAWSAWWYDQQGYSYESPSRPIMRTRVRYVPIPARGKSCFGRGTPVLTITGAKPIELLRIGDLVLSQDTRTGRLSYEPVVGLHHNPPMATLRVRLGNEEIISTTYHRFWRAGQGWAMARELRTGDILRTIGGRIEVTSIQADTDQPVFNLDVAENCTFFVGRNHLLVHDNSLPPAMVVPFDEVPLLQANSRQRP